MRKRTEKEKEENIWSIEEKKNGERKGGKYLLKEHIWSAAKGNEERRRKMFREGKYLVHGGEEERTNQLTNRANICRSICLFEN